MTQNSKEATALTLDDVTIGIITALPREYNAVINILELTLSVSISGKPYIPALSVGSIASRWKYRHVVAAMLLPDMGNDMATAGAVVFNESCPALKCIIMCGIAGAVPNQSNPQDHVRLGDIVISGMEGVIQYDLDKEEEGGEITVRNYPHRPAPFLINADRLLSSESESGAYPWEKYLADFLSAQDGDWQRPPESNDILNEGDGSHPVDPQRRPNQPRVFRGPIAAANKLLKNSKKRDSLRDRYKVKAVEMEGAGVLDATWQLSIGYFVVRGTCDYCNSDKDKSWQKYSAAVAAAYTRALIECVTPFSGVPLSTVGPNAVSKKLATDHALDISYPANPIENDSEVVRQLRDRIRELEAPINSYASTTGNDRTSTSSVSPGIPTPPEPEGKSRTRKPDIEHSASTTKTFSDREVEGSLTELARNYVEEFQVLRAQFEIEKLAEKIVMIEQWIDTNEKEIEPEVAARLWSELAIASIAIDKTTESPKRPTEVERARRFVERAKSCLM